MLFVTGDTHGNKNFDKLSKFAKEHSDLNKSDYMIIVGDFGAVLDKQTLENDLKPYSDLPFTTLFIDGNHENFDLLDSYPIERWCGGKTHFIKSDIIHLMRGQVYEIEGKTFFTFGGATSTDRHLREEGISWWRKEKPTLKELDEALANLNKLNNKVDFIITHSCDEKALWYPPLREGGVKMETFPENLMLSLFEDTVQYGHWYFGHYHIDGDLTDKKTVIFNKIKRLI